MNVSHLVWDSEPDLVAPIVIGAFEGWNDAGDAATAAIDHLIDLWDAEPMATIDCEDFFDFTSTRPLVKIGLGDKRTVLWPDTRIHFAHVPGSPDIILIRGYEPHLRWKTFCAQVLEVAARFDARLVLTLGALLADVPHSRPTSVFGTAYEDKVIDLLGLERSRYQGPTGIVGVLHDQCVAAGVNSASLWAAVPSYVPAAPSPKAAVALLDKVAQLLKIGIDTTELSDATSDYEEQIDELVAEDADTAAYVAQLEERHDAEALATGNVDGLVAEVERFLREN